MRHTPGPWRVSGCQLGSKLLIEHGNEETVSPIIGAVYTDGGRLPQQANAALIAAAPALYEALKGLYEQCVMVHKHWGDNSNSKEADLAIKQGQEALRLAEGGN